MKKILYTLIAILGFANVSLAQCGTIMVNSSTQIYPDTITNLPNAIRNSSYSTVIQLFTPSSSGSVALSSITVGSITGLPSGFTYTKTPSSGIINALNSGCIIIQSTNTTDPVGTYPIVINITVNTASFGSFSSQILGYKVNVISQLQSKKVSFVVDMTGQTVSSNGVHIAGNFQGWNPATNLLTSIGSNKYRTILEIPAKQVIEFKIVNGNAWGYEEIVPAINQVGHANNGLTNDNRWFYIDSIANDTSLVDLKFAASAPTGKYAVRFAVNMSQQVQAINPNGIHLAGNFQGWNAAKTTMVNFGFNNYEVLQYLTPGAYEYKFINGINLTDNEIIPSTCAVNNNRSLVLSTNISLTNFCFNSCTSGCNSITSGSNSITGNFQYDKIGETFNNQQTNGSIYRRLQLMPNNRIGATWTTSSDGSPFTGRGTGYNRYNGTTWEKGDTSITRIENQRSGFPSYAYNANNNEEVMLSHIVTSTGYSGGMILSRRTAGTNNAWTQTTVLDTISSVPGVLWCRTAISNNYLHVVACYNDSSGLQPNRVVKSGVRTPVVYSRYNFTTSQWQVINAPLPNYNTIRTYNGLSDSYSIDASGNNVAVLIGGITKDLSLWKSTNNGTSWTKTVVDSFSYSPYGATRVLMGDTTPTNDGAVHVLLDNIGKAHCFYARARVVDDLVTYSSWAYYPLQVEILYWNDSRTYANKSIIGTWEDTDLSSTYDLGTNWRDTRYGYLSTNTMPSAGISSDGKIFCTYSALTEYDEGGSGENFRDVHITYSSDGGNNWSDPRNITSQLGFNREQSFPSIARTVNNKIHLTFTESYVAGPNSAGKWDVKYVGIDTAAITQNQSFTGGQYASFSIVDTFLCKGKPLNFFLNNAELWMDTTLVVSSLNGQGWYNIPFNTSKTIYIKNASGVIFKYINIIVNDSLNLQRTTLSNTLNVCGLSTKFAIGGNTTYTGSKLFNWYRNDTLLSNTNAIDSFVVAGSYKLKAASYTGCKSELSFTVNKLNTVFNPDFSANKQIDSVPPFDFIFSNNTTPLADYNFTWKWGNGDSTISNNVIQFYTYSANGQYNVKLTAQNKITGCKDSIIKNSFIICSGLNPLSLSTLLTNPICNNGNTGSISVTAIGGFTPYQYKLNAGSYQTSNSFTNLSAGIYTVYVKDASNAIVSKIDTIINPAANSIGTITGLSAVATNSTQAYSISAQSGATYAWNIINGTLLSGNGTNSIQVQWAALAGVGKVMISLTKNACTVSDSLNIVINLQALDLNTSLTNPSCYGSNTGAISVTAIGGVSPYQYKLNAGSYQTSNSFTNLSAGIYTVYVKDASNAIVSKIDTLINPIGNSIGAISGLSAVATNSTQAYSISAQSGATYAWNIINGTLLSGNGTNSIQVQWAGLAGVGKVMISLTKNACTVSDSLNIVIGNPPLSMATIVVNPPCSGINNGSITVNAYGGNPPYQFKLNNGTYQTASAYSNLGAGIYTVSVKDALNNTVSKTDTINFQTTLNNPSISGSNGVPVSSTQNYNIASQNGVIYTWNIINGTLLSGNGTNSIQVQWAAIAGMGKVIANIAKNSCSAADTLVVSIGSNPLTSSTTKTDETCAGKANGAITINAVGGTSPYQYAMNNGTYQTGNTFNNLVAGIYVSKVKDASNVVSQQTDTINAGPGITVGAMNGPTTVPTSALSTYLVAQQTGATIAWTATNGIVVGGQATNIAQVSWGATAGAGMVKVKVTSAAGCVDSAMLNVTIGSTNISTIGQALLCTVYPNPAKDELIISTNQKLNGAHIIITDMIGRKMLEENVKNANNEHTVLVNELKTGAYILSIQKEGETSRIKFVKE